MSTQRLPARFNQAFARWWRKYIAAECPDARIERLRQLHVDTIKQDVALLEAMRSWEAGNQKRIYGRPLASPIGMGAELDTEEAHNLG
ncbi:MAG: hypothetical protein ACLPIX_05320 [Rhodomicrobium sp.]